MKRLEHDPTVSKGKPAIDEALKDSTETLDIIEQCVLKVARSMSLPPEVYMDVNSNYTRR